MKKNYEKITRGAVLACILIFCGARIHAQAPVTQTFVFTGAIQHFTVPPCVTTVTMQAWGAQGGSLPTYTGGLGAFMSGVFPVTSGQVLRILVGGQGGDLTTTGSAATGGGGGSFIANISNTLSPTPLLVAGGGGGRRNTGGSTAVVDGTTSIIAQPCIATPSTAGNNGNGGTSNEPLGGGTGGPGGGFYTNGGPSGTAGSQPGNSFLSGGAVALVCSPFTSGTASNGGFGGGGAGCWCYRGTPGGGGGFSGGGTGMNEGCSGGGGSYNAGTNQSNSSGVRLGNGLVTISYFYSGALTGVTASPTIICTGSSSTLTANSQVTYTWTPGLSNNPSIVISPTATSVYTVQGTNNQGCVSIATIAVNVNTAVPSLSVASTNTNLCAGKTVVYTASGALTYTWSNGINNGVPYTPAATGTYVVVGENACGTSSLSVTASVNPLPNITGSVNNPTICSGSSVILNGGNGVGTYTWNPSAPNNAAFVPPNTANYTVTGAGANNCTNTAVVGVTVLVTPTVVPIVTPTAMCLGGTATLSATGATGYTWTPGPLANTPSVTVSPPAPTTYTVTRTNGPCSSTSTVNLIIYPLPLVNASSSPSQICTGTGVNLVVVGPITQTWMPGGFTQSNFTVYPNFSTNYTVTGSNGNCTLSTVVPVVVNPNPTISITTSTNTICQGQSVSLNVNGSANNGPLTYTWLPSGNQNATTEILSPPTTTIVSVSATNTLNCISTQQQLIVVNQLPNVGMGSSLPFICAGNSAVLTMTNPSPNVVYNWSTGQSGISITANPSVTTNYIVIGTNSQTGCQNTNTITLSVYISTFVISSPTAICKGQTATLTASGPATSYLWTNVNGGTTAPSVTVSPVSNTTYSVTGTNGNCQNTQSVQLIVNPLPNVTAVAAKSQICRFEISTITGNGATSYSWNTGATTPAISFTLSITTTYTLTGTDNNSCSKTTTVTQFVATCIGIDEESALGATGVNIYPNPNNGNFTIRSESGISLNLVNALGQTVSTLNVNGVAEKEIKVNDLAPGIYFLTGKAGELRLIKKIIVEK